MSKVDWSKAPKWCNGYGLIGIAQYPVWFDDYYYEYLSSGKKHAFDDGCTFKKSDFSYTEERPKQPQAWSGPEDGLPPVGLKCMHGEEVVEILAHRAFKGHEHDPLLVVFATADDVSFSSPCCFRPIAREDQIAADQRESAIRELMDIAQVDCRVTAARLVDAGFKREVV